MKPRSLSALLTLLALLLPTSVAAASQRDADLAAARAVFERNLRAIAQRDRAACLACYLDSDDLVRTGPTGMRTGFEPLAARTPASGSPEWPEALVARDLRLAWIRPGLVYATYRYRVVSGGVASEGLSERILVETAGGWRIAVTTSFPSPPGTSAPAVALVGATVYDGRGGPPIEDATLVVREGRIEAVGPRSTTPVPEGIDVVDLAGSYVTPGLVDTHVHYSQTGWVDGRPDAFDVRDTHPYPLAMAGNREHPERFHRAFLASGVTAVFDVGGYDWTRSLGEGTESSPDAPHVSAAGALLATWVPAFGLADQAQFVLIEDEEDVIRAIRSHAALGSDAIKVWYIVRSPGDVERFAPLLYAAGEQAERQGLPLLVHATQLEAARVAIEAGARLLVHSVEDRPVDDAFVEAAIESGVYYCPTLTVREGYAMILRAELSEEVEGQLEWVDPSVRARVELTSTFPSRLSEEAVVAMTARAEASLRIMRTNLLRLHRAGVKVVLGTDAGNPHTLHGPSVFPEMEAMQAAGLSPSEILTAATLHAAEAMGRGDDLGALIPGRIADLLVLEEDPGEDIAHMRSITQVMRAGRLQERELLRPR